MTGEITLRGRVLPVGVREGVRPPRPPGGNPHVLPTHAQGGLAGRPAGLREGIDVHLVRGVEQVLEVALEPVAQPA